MTSILLIDDDPVEHVLFQHMLEGSKAECTFTGAKDLSEATKALENDQFDYVFLDNRLKPYNSFRETLPELRDRLGSAYLIVISADTSGIPEEVLAQYGVDELLNKDKIIERLDKL